MRIPLLPAAGTLSSLNTIMTSTEGTSAVQTPLQTGDTFVVSGTTLVMVKTDLAIPVQMITTPGQVYTTMKPGQPTTGTNTRCNDPFNENCIDLGGPCQLGCVPSTMNGGCQWWKPVCASVPEGPTTTRDVFIPTGVFQPPVIITSVVTIMPTTHIETTTSTNTGVTTVTTTVTGSGKTDSTITSVVTKVSTMTPTENVIYTETNTDTAVASGINLAYISGDPKKNDVSALVKLPRHDKHLRSRDGLKPPTHVSNRKPLHIQMDKLFILLVEAIKDAGTALKRHYMKLGYWPSYLHRTNMDEHPEMLKDGNTAGWWLGRLRNKTIAMDQPGKLIKKQLEARFPPSNATYWPGFTTDNTTANLLSWQQFKDQKAWTIDTKQRPTILLRHVKLLPPIIPKQGWIQDTQACLNMWIPFEQSGPLPSLMDKQMFLELDQNFELILNEFWQERRDPLWLQNSQMATNDEILEELRYSLLYKQLTMPILVEATPKEVAAFKQELLKDVPFIKSIGGEKVLSELWAKHDLLEVMKDVVRSGKIYGRSLRDLAIGCKFVISEGLRIGQYFDELPNEDDWIDDDEEEEDVEDSNGIMIDGKYSDITTLRPRPDDNEYEPLSRGMPEESKPESRKWVEELESRMLESVVAAKKNQRDFTTEGLEAGDHRLVARSIPFHTPKQMRRL
ncbi:hypothetical protein VP1G_05712 [Cytospora mali]|uniref:Uncharacterized protein n=1 Tax=Cytospora mali TaxID=578113 RepID=A0A194V3B5_CYTMA|nr:hypothetical protein VP1G_05712 [Valsa mali var. pyri (nom. inval.)]